MRTLREILEAFRRGDHLDSAELERLRQKMQSIADAASGMGDLFALQRAYALQVAMSCREYLDARDERRASAPVTQPSKVG